MQKHFSACVIAGAILVRVGFAANTLVPAYGTYFGGSGDINLAVAVAIDSSNDVIVAGCTTSQSLPGTQNAYQPTKATGFPDNRDVFIAKFDSTGSKLLWTTFLGGAGDDIPTALAVDSAGSIYIVGTGSTNFPITSGAYQASSSSGGFAAKISADGRSLLYSTFLPGNANALAIDSAGEAYMTGIFSGTIVTPGAIGYPAPFIPGNNGVSILRLNAAGTSLVFAAYLGGTGFNGSKSTAIAIDAQGNAYVAGFTGESNILTTANAFQPARPNSDQTAFILEINSTGSQLRYGTYFGPQYSATAIESIAVAPNGSVYLAGSINTTASWATQGAYLSTPATGFVAKLTPGTLVLDAFSFIPDADSYNTDPSSSPTIRLGPSSTLYLGFRSTEGFSVVELNGPTLSLTSAASTEGFAPLGLALTQSGSVWLVGLVEEGSSCPATCSPGNLISPNAYESVPPSPNGENVVIAELSPLSPSISFVGSSASGTSPFAPEQLVSIYGSQLGPSAGSGAQIGPDGAVTKTSGGTQVLFDGIPVPILYASAGQVNTAIPCAVAGKSSTQVVVSYLGAQSAPFTLTLATTAPGIFTLNGTGAGQGVVLNQDFSVNGPANPTPRGSEIAFYATGIGPASPCVDGQTYQTNFPTAEFPVVVGIGNIGAQVMYAGQAPGLMAGVAQINAVVPNDAPSGIQPLALEVNGVFSQPGVTVAVK